MFETEVSTDKKKVISSGSVISFSGEPVEIKLTQGAKEFLKLSFVFRRAEESAERKCPRMEFEAKGLRTMRVILTDFENPAGCGTKEPVPVAENGAHRIFLHFRVYALPGSDHTLVYNLYLEEK